MALSGSPAVLLLTSLLPLLLLLLLLGRGLHVQAMNSVESLSDIGVPEDNHLGQGKRVSYRAQEQRAIFDLLTGILETLQTSARAQVERERRKQLLEAALQHARDVTPPTGAKT